MTSPRQAGFSVVEALVVLMIAGTALLLVFQMGVKGSETTFRLGRRALAAADAEPGAEGLRTIVRGLALTTPRRESGAPTFGDTRNLSAEVSLDRATLCAPAGPVGRLHLRLKATPEGDLLTCADAHGEPRILMDLRPTRGRFSYSEDGAAWRGSLRLAQIGRGSRSA